MRRALVLGLVCFLSLASHAQAPLATVPRVDLDRYAGRWFEIAKVPNRFQNQCARDTTATYTRRDDGTVAVVNRCVRADGSIDDIAGVARVVDADTRAKLEVSFLPAWLRWTGIGWGRYWVIALADDYRYAVVGEPSREYLWILARAPVLDAADRAAIDTALRASGYDPARLAESPHSMK